MNPEEQTTNEQPTFENEEMKMPENSTLPNETDAAPRAVSGTLLALLALLLIAILGGLYYWFVLLNEPTPVPAPVAERPTPEENNEPESTTAEAETEVMQTVSTSDEVTAIEADIEATDLEDLDAEMNAIEAELDAALEAN